MKRIAVFFGLQSIVNLLSVLNALVFIPLMIGQPIRAWGWAVCYWGGFMVVTTASVVAQILINGAIHERGRR